MRLTVQEALSYLKNPLNALHLKKGRDQEKRHRLHILGEKKLLEEFLQQHTSVESKETYDSRLKVSPPASKPIYAQIKNVLSKVFTAYGTNFSYSFTRPEVLLGFLDYLSDTSRYGTGLVAHLEDVFSKKSLFGFQGVFLVDMPAELDMEGDGSVRPYVVYVGSKAILDMAITGNKVEYLILKSGEGETARYLVLCDNAYYTFTKDKGGEYQLLQGGELPNTLGYVPACPVTTFTDDSDAAAVRSSIVAPSLEIADPFLRDYSEHELNKLFHAFAQKWSYGVECKHIEKSPEGDEIECTEGYLIYGETRRQCPVCKGQGKVVPVGPDKTFLIAVPSSKDHPDVRPPAGYVIPDIESIQYLKTCVENGEDAIEKAVLGTQGYLSKTTKVETATEKELDMEPIKATLNRYKADLEFVVKFVLDTIARLRYESLFVSSSIHYGNKYFLKSLSQLETEYEQAKKAGLPNTVLYDYLEEIILVRHRDDPLALEENLLKLCLTPFPTMTEAEFGMAGYISQEDKTMRAYLNDYLERFEQENGDLSLFGSLLPKEQRVAKIKAILLGYNQEKVNSIPKPAVEPAPTA